MNPNRQTAQIPLDIHLFERIAICIALFLYPILLLTLHGGMSWMFAVLFIIALVNLSRNRRYISDTLDFPHLTVLSIAMASPTIAILLSQSFHADFNGYPYDGVSRLLLAIPILLVLRKVDIKHLGIIQYAFPLGAIGAFFAVKFYPLNQVRPWSIETYFLNHIHLGNLSLMLGALSVLSIHWMRKDPLWAILLKCAGFIAGLYVSMLTGSRGGWVALPFILFIWFYFRSSSKPWLKIGLAASLALVICIASYFAVHAIRSRIDLIYTDLLAFSSGNLDTSIGIRLQLWKAALHLFWENPFFGIGADGFKPATQALAASGYITPSAGEFGGAEVHNEILAHLVRFGIFGLISILLVYFVPFILFLKLANTSLHSKRTAAIMGLVLVVGFFIFGLTVEIFNLKMTIAFFSLTLAVLFAIASNKSEH
jgi:O-antigen ligase